MERPIKQWMEILGTAKNADRSMTSLEAAERIFGDIYYYRPTNDRWGSPKNPQQVADDMRQLANALEAYMRLNNPAYDSEGNFSGINTQYASGF